LAIGNVSFELKQAEVGAAKSGQPHKLRRDHTSRVVFVKKRPHHASAAMVCRGQLAKAKSDVAMRASISAIASPPLDSGVMSGS